MNPTARAVRAAVVVTGLVVAALVPTTTAAGAVGAVGAVPTTPVTVSVDGALTAGGTAAAPGVASRALAGYRIALGGEVTHRLRATVVVPTVDCTRAARTGVFVGAILFGRQLRGTGGDLVVASVDVTCENATTPDYGVLVGTAPVFAAVAVPVRPGDVLTFVLTSSPDRSTAAVLDARGRVLTRAGDAGFRVDAAQTTVQGGFGDARTPGYSRVPFTAVRFDDAPLADADPIRLVQRATDRTLLAAPGTTGAAGDAFAVRQVPRV